MIELDTLTYSVAKESDWNEILELWKRNTAWGELDKETLKSWINAPYQDCDIALARDNNRVIGLCFSTFSMIRTPIGIVKGVRFSAPIISSELKGTNLINPEHPINRLFAFAFKSAAKQGVELVYMNPYASWIRILKVSHKYGLPKFYVVQHNLSAVQNVEPIDHAVSYRYQTAAQFNESHEALWSQFAGSKENFYAIDRSSVWMNYKMNKNVKIEAYNSNNVLVGLYSYNAQKNVITDCFTLETGASDGLISFLNSEKITNKNFVKVVDSPNNREVFHSYQFDPLEYQHSFAVASLSARFSFEDPSQFNWFLTSLD